MHCQQDVFKYYAYRPLQPLQWPPLDICTRGSHYPEADPLLEADTRNKTVPLLEQTPQK